MLDIDQLSLWRGERCIQKSVSLQLHSGQAVQLLGENGAGKSTLLHAIAGLLEPESGEVIWQGQPIQQQLERWHQSLFFLPHRLPAHPVLTPLEILADSLALKGLTAATEQLEEALHAVNLLDQADQAAGSLSAGQQRRIWLARLQLSLRLLASENLWLLDEPLTSLDSYAQQQVADLIAAQCRRGGSVLFTSHQSVSVDAAQSLRLVVQA